jgi:hypothetical protein
MTRVRAAVIVAALALAFAAPSHAQTRTSGSIRLASQTSWVTAGGSFDLHLVVDAPAGRPLDLAVDIRGAVTSRSEFNGTIDGRLLRRSVKRVVKPVADLPVDGAGAAVVSLPMPRLDTPAVAETLPALRPGVYPVSVELRVRGGAAIDQFVTHLVRLPDDAVAAPLAVAWVQPVARSAGVIAAVGDAEMPMTLDVTPAALEGLPPDNLQPLREAVTGDDQLLASTWVPVDVSALVAAGHGSDVAAQRQVGDDALVELVDARGDLRVWSSDRPLTSAAIARLRELGVTRFIVPEASLEPLPASVTGRLTLTRPFSIDAGDDDVVDGAAVDENMDAHFGASRNRVLAAHQLLADLAVLYFDSPGNQRGVVVRAPHGWSPSPSFLRIAFDGIRQAAILRPLTIDGLFQTVPMLTSRGRPVVRSVESVRVAALPAAALTRAHDDLDQLASIVGPGSPQAETARRQLLAAESELLTRAERANAIDKASAALDAVRSRLRMADNRTVRLTAREGSIPITIYNDNSFPVHVQLVLSSEKLEFTAVEGSDRTRQVFNDLLLEPGNNSRSVKVRARASAAFSMRATLLAPDGHELVRSRFTIVSTVFSGVGVVLSIVSALFLLVWWARHWRTSRRDRRLVQPSDRGAGLG